MDADTAHPPGAGSNGHPDVVRNGGGYDDHHSQPPVPPPRRPSASLQGSGSGSGLQQQPPRVLNLRDLEPTGPPDRTYKVVFAGDAAVGKTSFINRITKGYFISNLSSTLGVDFQVKTIRVDERNIAIQLWDTAGKNQTLD